MKTKYYLLAALAFLLISFEGIGQIYRDGNWYTIHEGTMTFRTDGSASPSVNTDEMILGTYYGADVGGLKTNWGNSGNYTSYGRNTGYIDLTMFKFPDLTRIDEPSDIAVLPRQSWGGFLYWADMNARLALPHAYESNPTGPEKYPLIVMMHGVGETATCRGRCALDSNPEKLNNDHNVYHGGREHLDAINRDPSDPQHWPGFVLFPQSSNGWGYYPSTNIEKAERFIEAVMQKYPIDPYRIYIHGLSNGGQGSYLLAYDRPDLIAAMAPMSGTEGFGYKVTYGYGADGLPNFYPPEETLVHIPIWQFQGANDGRPTPAATQARLQPILDAGGNIRYHEYPNTGHNTWTKAYREPDFFSWFLSHSKLSIHSFYGITEICEGSTQKLGVTGGFMDYDWQKSTNGGASYASFSSIPGRSHEILADEAGLYRVRIQRDAGDGQTVVPEWSDWSDPFELFSRERPQPVISTNGSWVLWGLDNNTSLTLSADNPDANNYVWYKNGAVYATGDTQDEIVLNLNGEGVYTLQYDDNFCTSFLSDPVYINRAPTGGGEPLAPSNLQGASTSISTTTIWWQDNATSEIGYEVYRSLDGTNYTWLGNYGPNMVTFDDSNLPAGQTIYYKVRAFNENGASSEATVGVVMPADNTPPAVPANFEFARFQIEEYRINERPFTGADEPIMKYDEYFEVHLDSAVFTWNSVAENSTINYDIYAGDGTFIGTTQDTTYVVPGLVENESYSFYVKARDINNLESGKSQQASVFTALNGLYYYYYEGAIWDEIADYSFHPYSDQGPINNFLINAIPEHNFPDYFAYDFIGYIRIDTPGEYDFRTNSDDGSSLWIGGTKVVDNDGLHGSRNREGSYIFSEAGIYPITVKFFERTGGNSLAVSWRPPGQSGYTSIPDSYLTSSTSTPADPPAAPTNLSAVANGYSVDLTWDHEMEDIHVVVLGSSTAVGTGASSTANSWVAKFEQSLEALNSGNSLSNLAVGGYTTYELLPTGTSTPGNRPNPDPAANISAALSQSPDIIIVNLPSNDRNAGFDLETETLNNFTDIQDAAIAAGVEIYFTTTQPRNFASQGNRDLLATEAMRIQQLFGEYAINIYDELAALDGSIKVEYSVGDNIHLNDAGHDYLYQTIWNKVSEQSIPIFEVFRSEAGGGYVMAISTNKQQVTITDPSLLANTLYSYQVRSSTTAGSSLFSTAANATTTGDTEPPSIPLNFRKAATTESQITIVWDASTDNVAVDHYVVVETSAASGGRTGSTSGKENMVEMGQTDLTSLTLTGLTPLESFDLAVFAVDASGNESDISNQITVQTQAPLPVEFLDVSYRITDDGVLVTWATASELNNAYFTVERGTGLDDFTEIGAVEGSGTTTSRRDYIYLDTNPMDLAYYRIKQTDFDGQYDYSKIIRVVYNEGNLEEFKVYPNPTVQENINARGFVPTIRSSVEVKLMDVMGKVHMVKVMDPNEFLNGMKIDLDYALPPGVYIIQVSDGATNTQRRVVIR